MLIYGEECNSGLKILQKILKLKLKKNPNLNGCARINAAKNYALNFANDLANNVFNNFYQIRE